MYKISVPVQCSTLDRYGRDFVVKQLKEMGAERVFLCPSGNIVYFREESEKEMASLKNNIGYMKAQGFEVGVWVWAFQHRDGDFTYVKSPSGRVSASSVCPTDKKYTSLMADYAREVASYGIDLFMFDDDFRYTHLDNGFNCCCDNHLKMISHELGEDVSIETMEQHLCHGGKSRYRDAFLKANGKALGDFAAAIRKEIDKVNPDVRLGFCACIGSWDMDGIHPDEAAGIMAGKTKPFYRLIGAPYWAREKNWGNRLSDVIECERIEASRRKDDSIEIFSECDMFPRPRFMTPAAYAEGFDTALRASGCMDGILKYVMDYTSDPHYETGYVDRHIRNIPLYDSIDKIFGDKTSIGIRVFDTPQKYASFDIPENTLRKISIQDIAFNMGSRLLTNCSLPSVYTGSGYPGVAFGQDVMAVKENDFAKGLIIDLEAAGILREKGIDTGIVDTGEEFSARTEAFIKDGNKVSLPFGAVCKKTVVSENAEIQSLFSSEDEETTGSFFYENADGQKFLVFCFDAYFNREELFRQYTRAKQIIGIVPRLCGKNLPAVITGHPDLYVQLKENDTALAIGLWNFFPDDIPEPVIELSFEPESVNPANCSCEVIGKKLKLSRIEPYGTAFIEIKK